MISNLKRVAIPSQYYLRNLLLLYFIFNASIDCFGQNTEGIRIDSLVLGEVESLNSIKSGDYYLLKINSKAEIQEGVKESFQITNRLSSQSFIVRLNSDSENRLDFSKEYFKLYNINNNWKKSPNVTITDEGVLNGEYWLKIMDKSEWNIFEASHSGINTIAVFGNNFKVDLTDVALNVLLKKRYITYIEKIPAIIKNEARVIDLNLNPNRINTIHAYRPHINGADEVVSIKEPFYEKGDIDLKERYLTTGSESDFIDAHALEMATIIAGNGNSFLTGLGVAPHTFHTSSSNSEIAPNSDDYFKSNGILTQNHSYGTEIESFYGVAASLYDEQAYRNHEVLHVFSVGNSGLESSDHGKYQGLSGYSNITGNFKQAKNVLTIGAVDTSMNTIQLNSNGPAFDGRIKPELVAYSMTGTSNSAALVSGVSVLLQQAYRKLYGNAISSSLTKAVLINSADDIAELGPDHKTGYGSTNAYDALLQLENERFIEGEIQGSSERTYSISVPENAINFKATLVWTDPPAQANDAVALINDLNIRISDKQGQIFLPWVLATEAKMEELTAAAGKGIDHLNNIEQIHISTVESDSVEISVTAENTLAKSQAFSIAYNWEIENEFSWTSPTFNDNIPYNGETTSHIRWQSSYPENKTGDLYFKLTNEENWELIREQVQLSDENFRWNPAIFNDLAQLKMIIEEQSYVSDTFSISSPLRLNVGFNCTDSLSFYWDSIKDADYYTLYNLEGSEMKPLFNTQDTVVTMSKSDLSSSYLKIQPIKRGKALVQSGAVDFNLQGSNCFLESYYVEAIQEEGIYHNLQLSSLNGVEKIVFEKRMSLDNNWKELAEYRETDFEIEYLEPDPDNGFNSSRAIIYFSNGERIVSEIQSAYFVNSSPYIVYPNPLIVSEDLRVFAKEKDPNAIIEFYNAQGQEQLSFPIPNDRNFLDLSVLNSGLYFYIIRNEELSISQGKILIHP